LSFSFHLYNPVKQATKADVSVTASLTPFFTGTSVASYEDDMDECTADALDTIYKHNVSPYAGDHESWPLRVRNLLFEKKTIHQATPHSGCHNTISVTLQTNVPLIPNEVCQPKISIKGLKNANHTNGRIALVAPPGACPIGVSSADFFKSAPDGIEEYGKWKSADFSLTMFSAARTTPGVAYVFSIEVQNPHAGPGSDLTSPVPIGTNPDGTQVTIIGQDYQSVTIVSEECPLDTSCQGEDTKTGIPFAEDDMEPVLQRPCCLCSVGPEDTGVMRVKAPEFCTRNIGQSSPWPCDNNTLTLQPISMPTCRQLKFLG